MSGFKGGKPMLMAEGEEDGSMKLEFSPHKIFCVKVAICIDLQKYLMEAKRSYINYFPFL